jgi:hypothetical protein
MYTCTHMDTLCDNVVRYTCKRVRRASCVVRGLHDVRGVSKRRTR